MDDNIKNNRLIGSILSTLSYIGLVHFKSQKYSCFSFFTSYFVIFMYVIFDLTQIIFFIKNRSNPKIITLNFGSTALVIQLMVKCINCVMYRKTYYAIYKNIHEDLCNIEERNFEGEKDILNEI